MKPELGAGLIDGRILILGMIVEWGLVLLWTGIIGQWVYRQGRRRGWWDKFGHELDLKYPAAPDTGPAWAQPRALGVRVLQDRFRTWPKIYQGGTDARPVVTLKARYASPASVKSARFLAALAAVVLFMVLERRVTVPVIGDDSAWWQTNIGALILCAVIAWAAWLILRVVFPRLWFIPGWERALVMRFEGGGITWGRGPRWLKTFQFWRTDPRGYVGPEEEARHAEKVPVHRKAEAEAEANEERRQRRRKPRPMFYQKASEVVMFVGEDNESWRPVAELSDDPTAQWAARLASAINAADDLARSLLPKKEAQPPRPVLVVPLPGRPDAPQGGGLIE